MTTRRYRKDYGKADLLESEEEEEEEEEERKRSNLTRLPLKSQPVSTVLDQEGEEEEEKDRIAMIIPLLDSNSEYREAAIEYVNKYKEFALINLNLSKYHDCLTNTAKSIFASEVLRCMILTDSYAKSQFYTEMGSERWSKARPNDVALTYAASILDVYRHNVKTMLDRTSTYRLLNTEDVVMLDHYSKQVDGILQYQVVCISDFQYGFLGMIYCRLESWPIDKIMRIDKKFKNLLRGRLRDRVRIVGIYGIRSSATAILTEQKHVAQSLIFGVVQYAIAAKMHMIHVIRHPLGLMSKILRNFGFDDQHYLPVHTNTYYEHLQFVDMGCIAREILRPNSGWLISQGEDNLYFDLDEFYST
jgi:hypothetical protein